jgi:hypothetical protein
VTAAARDPRIAAVIAQIPVNGFPRKVEGRSTASTLRLLAAMNNDWLRGKLHLRPHYIPAVGPRGDLAVMTGEDATAVVAGLATTTWRNEVAPRALLEMMRYRPSEAASRVSCPLLVCVGDKDIETIADSAASLAEGARCGEVLRYPITHFDFYREEFRRRVTADQIRFLRKVPALLQ